MDLVVVAEATALPVRSSLLVAGNTTAGGEQAATPLVLPPDFVRFTVSHSYIFCACN